jgi:lipopolysaccharide export system permease protein
LGRLLQLHYKKYAIPVACMAMGLLALPLGHSGAPFQKRHLGSGLAFFFSCFITFFLSIGIRFWREMARYPPMVGMWVPNFVLGGFGIYLLMRSAGEKQMTFSWLDPVVVRMIKWVGKK